MTRRRSSYRSLNSLQRDLRVCRACVEAGFPLESWPGTLTAQDEEIASVVARGPVWRDPATGKRAVAEKGAT